MITFLEGLPRSGKSHCAVKDEIIPALKKGRPVFAYIDGLNHDKIGELAGIGPDRCRELLTQVEREQVKEIWRIVTDDALVVLDEVQNFWPADRAKLDAPTTLFITEHGHHGLDIVLMGQAMSRIHAQWRLLVERKIYYLKKTALGKPDEYKATFYTVVPKGKDVAFEVIQTIDYKYDPAIFGAYKSHTDGTTNKDTAIDQRAIVWNTKLFRRWLPLFGLLFLGALGYLVWFFKAGMGSGMVKRPTVSAVADGELKPVHYPPVATAVPVPSSAPVLPALPAVVAGPSAPLDVVEDLNRKGRIRFAGFVRIGNITKGFFEWRDSGNALLQSMTMLDLSGLGYAVMVNQTGTIATLTKGATSITAFAWPVDKAVGRVSETDQAKIAGTPRGMMPGTAADVYRPAPVARMEGY